MIRFVIIILFLAAAVFLFFTQTRLYFDDIKVLKDEKESIDEALQYSRELQTLRNDLLNKRNAISREDIDKLNKIIPAEISSGEIITMLEDVVKKHNLMLKKIDVNEKKAAQNGFQDSSVPMGAPPPPFRTIDLSLYISGPYDYFLLFLKDLEKSLRVIDVGQIDFSGGTSDVFEFKISARAYAAFSSSDVSGASGSAGKNDEARAILAMLAGLKAVKIDSDFFQKEAFKNLQGFVPVMIIPSDYGRPNPFRPAK